MGTSRTSNKDVLNAIQELTQAITGMVAAPASPAPVVNTAAPATVADGSDLKVDKTYKDRVTSKVQAKANEDGEDRIMYARRNLKGELKLAYCLASRWTSLRDNGLVGAIAHIKPE